ncbi:MAG: glycosyltransferase family 9 protein [Flavobacteriaceae bacterium]|nr:glycosyltransferase family 9 protein [Flavobacteriaceae bacterium]
MNILKSINSIWRLFMHVMTSNIGKIVISDAITLKDSGAIKKILICRPNHRLGNQLLITPIVLEAIKNFPEAKIDLFLKGGLGSIIFKNYNEVNKIIYLPRQPHKNPIQYIKAWLAVKSKHYDIVINAVKGSSSGKAATRMSRSKYKVYDKVDSDITKEHKDAVHMAKSPVYCFRNTLKKWNFKTKEAKVPVLDIKLSSSEKTKGRQLLQKMTGNANKTICLFTYATDDKCHPESWWLPFYEKLQKTFPDYNIIEVLPVENVSQIQFKAPTLYSKDIREMAALIANTKVFIGADGGVMHLACAAQTPTVGLFSRDNQEEYAPYGNSSLALNTNYIDLDGCIKAVQNILV